MMGYEEGFLKVRESIFWEVGERESKVF